jgi:N-methylhydantoinase B
LHYVRTGFDHDGGAGAVAGYDGYVGAVVMGAVQRGNVEEEEVRFPWRMVVYEIAPDLEGAGRWRGAPGTIWESLNEGGDVGMATGSSDGDLTQGPGALGGEPTPLSKTYVRHAGELKLARSHRMHRVLTGDSVLKLSGGGAGVGQPEERDPEKVREDVSNGLISLERAHTVYKVAFDSDTLAIDQAQTKMLRGTAP